MGDCAIVIFHSEQQHEVSPAVYLHRHGGLVLRILETALPSMRTGDAGFSFARFIGCCHEGIPPNTGLGVLNVPGVAPNVKERQSPESFDRVMAEAKKFDWGGRGIFLIDVDHWRVTHAGSSDCDYGDIGDGFGMQEETELRSVAGVVQLPANAAGT